MRAQSKNPADKFADNILRRAAVQTRQIITRGAVNRGSSAPPVTTTRAGTDDDDNVISIGPMVWGYDNWGDPARRWG